MADLIVHPQPRPLEGRLASPPDAAVAEIALILAALAPSAQRLRARGLPSLRVIEALALLGVEVTRHTDGIEVRGGAFEQPPRPLPCPASPAAMGLLAGVLAAQRFASQIDGDAGAMRRPMDAAARALRARGAIIEGSLERPGELGPPIEIAPAPTLSELSYEVPAGATAGKTAALGSGLFAEGPTFIHEILVGDDRLERQLVARGVEVATAGSMLRLTPLEGPLAALDGSIPGDAALAAVLAAGCLAVPESLVGLDRVIVSPSRSGWIELLRDAGAALALVPLEDSLGEATAELHLRADAPGPLRLAGERAHRAGVPLPILAAMAAFCGGESQLFEVPLRHPGEVDDSLALLAAFEIEAARVGEGIVIRGGRRPLSACAIDAPDAVVAMAAAVLALAAGDRCQIRGADPIVAAFPRFVGCFRALGARIDVQS